MSIDLETKSGQGTTTLATRLRDRALSTPSAAALREKDLGIWKDITWSDYWAKVQEVAHGLLALGVEPGDRVAIHSENRPEWVFCDVANASIRAVTMGLYPTNPAAEVSYLLGHSQASILIAEDQEQVEKALAIKADLPYLKKIIYIEPRGLRALNEPFLMSWEDLITSGRSHAQQFPRAIEDLMSEATPEDLMTLIYTSGTTGSPKGAMLSVANIEFAIQTLVHGGGFTSPPPHENDVLLSYLPLSHVAERIFTLWFNIAAGPVVHFAESIETVPQNLQEVQPTIFLGVPRIWEKLVASVQIRAANASLIKRLNFKLWSKVASWIGDTLVASGGRHTPATKLMYLIGYPLVFRTIKDKIGMRKCRYAASGSAPIAPEVLRFFMGLGVPMYEVYGMTENTAVATANRPGRVKLGTVGEPHPDIELMIDDSGEILTRHPGNFVGYWRDPEATAKIKDPDGWLHTGDVGEWVDGTHLKITDRMKDIIITSGGKNISPSEIENALKASPFIKEAVVVGDARNYLTALIGIELDTVGDWATRRRIPFTTYRDLSSKPEVKDLIQAIVDDVNTHFSRVEGIKRFELLPKELDHEDGELTATQKVKRVKIIDLFGPLVEEMYRS